MLFISQRTWRRIRDQFSEGEKATLRSAILNNVIAPYAGVDLDVDRVDAGLREKILGAVLGATAAIRQG